MRAILTVARLHLTLVLQDRGTYLQAFAVPAILMFVLSLALNEDAFDFVLKIDVVDQDQSGLSQELIHLLQAPAPDDATAMVICLYGAKDNPSECDLSEKDQFEEVGTDRLKEKNVSATLIIPKGLEENLTQGKPVALEYRSDEQLNTQTLARTAIQTRISQFSSSISIATVGTQTANDLLQPYPDVAARNTAFADLRSTAQTALTTPPIAVNATSTGKEAVIIGLGARQSVPGMGSMFVLFSLLSIAQFMVEERTQGTLQRLFTLPTAKVNIVLGKILGTFLFGCFQFGVFVLIGVFLGVNWGNDYLAVAALIASYSLAGTALGFLLSTFVKTSAQAASMITFGGLILAPLGGAWWSLTIVPDFMRIAGHISPIAWVTEGFQELLYHNGTLVDVLPMCGALLVYAAIYTALAVWNFRYE